MPQTKQNLTVNITNELTLTPLAGASLVNDILKGLLYQKCQIPYPYSWLKQVVEKRRKRLSQDDQGPKKVNLAHENHYRVVSAAFDQMEMIMKSILKEFCESTSQVKEVLIVFGASSNCPKEVFTIDMPLVVKGHIERNHIAQLNKHLQKVLRNIFLSQEWMDSIDGSIPCTNTYIYLKKLIGFESPLKSEAFEPCAPFYSSPSTKHLRFSITYTPNDSSNCCSDLEIFEDNGSNQTLFIKQAQKAGMEEQIVWCRSKGLLKGFRDCFINKVSVCELW